MSVSTCHARGLLAGLRSRSRASVPVLIAALFAGLVATFGAAPARATAAPTRLGLHVTDVELEAWRARATSGPYRRAGDAGTNSPGDWDRITANRAAFLTDPASFRWAGPADSSGCVDFPGGTSYDPPVRTSRHLRDTAFHSLVTGDATARRVAAQALVAQASVPNLDFSNRARWCLSVIKDLNPGFEIANWLTSLLYAFEYIEIGDRLAGTSSLSASDRATVLGWMYHAAEFMNHDTNASLRALFTDRDQRTAPPYTLTTTFQSNPYYQKAPYDGVGNTIGGIALYYNNRRAAQQRFVGLVGLHLSTRTDGYVPPRGAQGYTAATYVADATKFAKDFLVYSTYPAGYVGEFERWKDTLADLGWAYAGQALAPILTYVDAHARTGDRSLADYTTSAGVHNTQGTPAGTTGKNWRWAVQQYVGFRDGSQIRYIPGRAGDPAYRIDGTHGTWAAIHEVMFTPFNRYWKDAYLDDVFLRRVLSPYPSSPASVGQYSVWNGDWGTLPATMFMTAQMPAGSDPFAEATTEPVTEPVLEPAPEPTTEPAPAPAPEPTTEPTTEPKPKSNNGRRPKAMAVDTAPTCPDTFQTAGFVDVAGSVHLPAIECLSAAGLVAGTTSTTFSPVATVTRGQLATFVARLLQRVDPTLAGRATTDRFRDDDGNTHERSIELLADLGIVGGTGDGRYAPGAPVRRDQVASVLLAAHRHLGGAIPTGDSDYFADDDGTVHERSIDAAAALGIVTGVGADRYAPASPVTRGQLATLIARVSTVASVSLR